jgi:hypothetical protein
MEKHLYRTALLSNEQGGEINYFLLDNDNSYGIGIDMGRDSDSGMSESSYAENITTEKIEAENLLNCFADECVQPIHLYELIENYLGEL